MENWVLLRKGADFQHISEKFHISPRVASLIRNRDVIGDDAIEKYLKRNDRRSVRWNADEGYGQGSSGSWRKDKKKMQKSGSSETMILMECMSTYILLEGLRRLGADVDSDIPDRITDGYGLNRNI